LGLRLEKRKRAEKKTNKAQTISPGDRRVDLKQKPKKREEDR